MITGLLLLLQLSFRPDVPVGIPGASTTGGRASYAKNYVIDTVGAAWVGALDDPYVGYYRANLAGFFAAAGARNGIMAVSTTEWRDITVGSDSSTLWGQTAPGRYILAGRLNYRQTGDNFIIEHMMIINGDSTGFLDCEDDCIELTVQSTATTDFVGGVVSHCTLMYGIDNNFDIRNQDPDAQKIDSIFLWRNAFLAPLDLQASPGNACNNHSYNVAIGLEYIDNEIVDDTKANRSIVMLENVLSHAGARNPLVNADITFANNLISGADHRYTYLRNEGDTIGAATLNSTAMNFINNYYDSSAWIDAGLNAIEFGEGPGQSDTLETTSTVYLSGNIHNWTVVDFYDDDSNTNHVGAPAADAWATWGLTLRGASHLMSYLIPRVGANYRYRTTNETKVYDDITNGTGNAASDGGGIIESVSNGAYANAGGYPSITYTKRTFTDLPASPNADGDGDGYTNLEEWIWTYTKNAEYQLNTVMY